MGRAMAGAGVAAGEVVVVSVVVIILSVMPNFNLMVMIDSQHAQVHTSTMYNHINITAVLLMKVLMYTHLHLNQKNINHLVLATSPVLTTQLLI